ncbi:hypothetical protein [Anaeromyxobacter diazotrophicus]|uniref:Uncharacterized protein n=1 Tax=Anaeromyxobacter diazotrophicus TaxID=2590199 RepID=A0A7I9VRZ0_9BACT|nr:hypothetical protein [Anaeromyxobacter diazotrophicus]GEJ58860.1 hypothetical protein AMYX_36010 [Anaeromyxobacter diazotrophicus]
MNPAACPHCDAPRVDGPECPRCGVIYARAHRRAPASGTPAGVDLRTADAPSTAALASTPGTQVVWGGAADDARTELTLRAIGPPVALLVSWLLVSSPTGHMLVRTFLSMWVHELGHAAAAWLCGHLAFPGPWRTPISDSRHALVVLVVAASFAYVAWRGWAARSPSLIVTGAAGLVAQLVCVLLPARPARAFITFAGDGGALVLGTLLMSTIYVPPESRIRQGALRWGFLAIGAASFVDAFRTWLGARSDPDAAPLGEIEGVGLSDPSALMQVHGWSLHRITGAYVGLGTACAAAFLALYVYGLLRARRR